MDSRRRELLSGGVDPSISISVNTLNFDADSSTASFTVTSNTDWTLSGANSGWYTASPVSGGRGTTTITINVTANTSDSNTRVGTISAITRKRNVTAELTVIQIPDWITTATYSISNILANPAAGIAAGGGTSTINGGVGSIVYEWKSGKANTTGTFTPNKAVARTSGSTSGSASISGKTVTVNSLGSNLYNGNTVFTVTYSYNPGNPPDSRTTVVSPASKTCTVTQNKNIITDILMSNPGAGAIPNVSYGAGAETKSFTSTTAASNPGVTLVFSSTSSIAGTTTHGTLSGPTYSWTSSNTSVATLTSANAASLNVTSVTRGTTYGTATRTSTITRTASYTYTLNSTYSAGASATTQTSSASCTGTVTQAANLVAVTSIAPTAGAITSSVSFAAGGETKTWASTTAATVGTATLTFDSGSTVSEGSSPTYGTWSGPAYAWSSNQTYFTVSSSTATASVTAADRGTTLGAARTATITRSATIVYTLKSNYTNSGRTSTMTKTVSCTGTATQVANEVTYSIPQYKGLKYNQTVPAAGGTATLQAPDGYIQYATYTSSSVVEITSGATSTYARAEEVAKFDPEFYNGTNGISRYDNNSSGRTTVSRVTSGIPTGIPNNSSYALKVGYNPDASTKASSPYLGGFHLSYKGTAGETYVCTFDAWIPEGYTLSWHTNSIGSGGTSSWTSPYTGKGRWMTYGRKVTFGTSPSTSFYFALIGPTDVSVNWYIGSVYLAKVTNVTGTSPTINTTNGSVTLDSKGTTTSSYSQIALGTVYHTLTLNGKTADIVIGPEQMPNAVISTDASAQNFVSSVSVGNGLGAGTCSAGTSATVTYSASHTAWDQYSSGEKNNQHTVYDPAVVALSNGSSNVGTYSLSGSTSGASSSNTCTISLSTLGAGVNSNTYSLVAVNNNDLCKAVQKAYNGNFTIESGTTGWAVARYATFTISGGVMNVTKSSGTSYGGQVKNTYVTGLNTSHIYYCAGDAKSGATTHSVFIAFRTSSGSTVTNRVASTNSTDWTHLSFVGSPSATSNIFVCQTGISSTTVPAEGYFRNVVCIDLTDTFGAGNEPDKEQCDQIFANYVPYSASTPNTKAVSTTTGTVSNAIASYGSYSLSGAKSTSSNVPVGGTDTYYATITSTKIPTYTNGCSGGAEPETFKITAINNCTLWSASGGTGTQYTTSTTGLATGTKIYIKVGTNYNTQNTRTVSFTVQSTNSSSTTHTVSWTQTADTLNFDCSVYNITLTNSTNSIPCAGTSKTIYTTVGITCTPKYVYAHGGTVVNGTVTNTGTASLSGSNMTPTNSSGTTISTATNGTKVYWTVSSNGVTAHNVSTSSTRSCSLTASITGCSTETKTATIIQAADTADYYTTGFRVEWAHEDFGGYIDGGSYIDIAGVQTEEIDDVYGSYALIYKWETGGGYYKYSTGNITSDAGDIQTNMKVTSSLSGVTFDNSAYYDNYTVYATIPANGNNINTRSITLTLSVEGNDYYGAGMENVPSSVWTDQLTDSITLVQTADTLETDYYKYTVSWGGWKIGTSTVSTVGVGGTTNIFNTCNILRSLHKKYVYGGGAYGYSGSDTGGSVTITGTGGMTGISKTTTAGTTTSLTGITNGQKIYLNVPCRGAYTTTRTLTLTPSAGVTAASSGNAYNTASINQAANSSSSAGYKYTVSITKSGTYASSNIPTAGLTSGTAMGTLNVSVVPMYSWQCGSDTAGSSTTGSNSNTVTLTGTNCTLCTSASGTFAASITAYNGQTIYMKATCNGQTTYTRSIKVTPSAGASAYSSGNTYTAQTWTQAADTNTMKYEYQASITKSGTYASANIPAAGLTSGTSVGNVSISVRPVYIWNTCGGVTKGSWGTPTTTHKVTFTGTNCTLNTSSSGTFAASKSLYNGQTVYIKVGCNGGNGSTKNISIVPSNGYNEYSGGEHTYTTTTWTQAADTISSIKYSYTVTLTKQSNYTSSNIPVGGLTSGTNVAKVNVSVVPYNTWAACGTVTTGSSTTGGTANTVTVTGTNCTLSTSASDTFGSTGTFYNGQAVYIKVSSNSQSESTRTITLATSAGADASTGGHSYGSKTWTQAADAKTLLGYTVAVTINPTYTQSIPVAGISKTAICTIGVKLYPYYQWTSTGTIFAGTSVTGGSSDKVLMSTTRTSGSWTFSTSSNGTYADSAWVYNGQTIYATIPDNYQNSSVMHNNLLGPNGNSSSYNISKTLLDYNTYSAEWTTIVQANQDWVQNSDTNTSCYEWSISFTKDGSWTGTTQVPRAGDSSGKRVAKVTVQRRLKYTWDGQGTITYGSWSNYKTKTGGLTLRVSVNDCTIAKSTGTTVPSSGWATSLTNVYHNNYIFLKPGNNNLNASTREIIITADDKGCTDNPGGELWTQAADSIASTSYMYQVTFTKSGTYASNNIPDTGLTSATSMGTVGVKYKGVYTWSSGGTTTDTNWTNATSSSGKTVTLAVTNGTLNTSTTSSGFAASKSGIYNGQTIYFKINANDTSSTRTITLSSSNGTSAVSSGNEYGSATWTQAAQTLTLAGYQYRLTENEDLFQLVTNLGFSSSDANTCEEYAISPQVQLDGPIGHTVQVMRRPIYQSATTGTQSAGSDWEVYNGSSGSTGVLCFAYDPNNETWDDEATWSNNDAEGFYVYSDRDTNNRITSFVSSVTINSIYVFSNLRKGRGNKALHVQYIMNSNYPNMITSGTFASSRSLPEDSESYFDYMQKGDYITSTTYGNITADTWSNSNWNWYDTSIDSDGTFFTTVTQGAFSDSWKPYNLCGVHYGSTSGYNNIIDIAIGADNNEYDPIDDDENAPFQHYTLSVPLLPIGTSIHQTYTKNWSCSGSETATYTTTMGGAWASPLLTDGIGITVTWPPQIQLANQTTYNGVKLFRSSYDKNKASYYVNTHNMYYDINRSSEITTISITGRGGKTYTIGLRAELERGLRIAHFLDLCEPNSTYRHIEEDPYSIFKEGSVSVPSAKYGVSSGYWKKTSVNEIGSCGTNYGSTKYTYQLALSSSSTPGLKGNPLLTVVSHDVGDGNVVPDISLSGSGYASNSITSQLGGFPVTTQYFNSGWDGSAYAIFSSGTEVYNVGSWMSLQPDKNNSIIGISNMLNLNPGADYHYSTCTNNGMSSSYSSYDIFFNHVINHWRDQDVGNEVILSKGTINMPISIHRLSSSYPYAHVAAITLLGKTSSSGSPTWLPASINPFNVPSRYNYSFTSTDIIKVTTPYYNGSVFDYSCNSNGNTLINFNYDETRGFWVLLVPMGFSWPVWEYRSGGGIDFSRSGSNIITQSAAQPDPNDPSGNCYITFGNTSSIVRGTGTSTSDSGTKYSGIICGYSSNYSYYPVSCYANHATSAGLVTQNSIGYNNGGNNISNILKALRKPFGILCRFDTMAATSTGSSVEYLTFNDANWNTGSNNTKPGRITIYRDGMPGGGSSGS